MNLTRLDHVNMRTSHLPEMVRFYEEVLGLHTGWRPGFSFGGAWLYTGEQATVHLVEVAEQPEVNQPQLEHFCFRAQGLRDFVTLLTGRGIQHRLVTVPDNHNTQVFLRDPDGNHIEIQFDAGERLE